MIYPYDHHSTAIFDYQAPSIESNTGKIIQFLLMPDGSRHEGTHTVDSITSRLSVFFGVYQSELQEVLLSHTAPDGSDPIIKTYLKPTIRHQRSGTSLWARTVYISQELRSIIEQIDYGVSRPKQ